MLSVTVLDRALFLLAQGLDKANRMEPSEGFTKHGSIPRSVRGWIFGECCIQNHSSSRDLKFFECKGTLLKHLLTCFLLPLSSRSILFMLSLWWLAQIVHLPGYLSASPCRAFLPAKVIFVHLASIFKPRLVFVLGATNLRPHFK